jgi:hypothetical protein
MIAFGAGVYFGLGAVKHEAALRRGVKTPEQTHPRFSLPGTIVVAQGGTLYKLVGGKFTPIAKGSWTQPAATPDHQHLIAVRREFNYSDLYELGLDGSVERQLTNDAGRNVPSNQWAFYPRVTSDGQTLYYDFDPKYVPNNFSVNLSVYSMPLGGTQAQGRRWTVPTWGPAGVPVGGDVEPVPLDGGGFVEARYSINSASLQYGQIWLQKQAVPAIAQYTRLPEPGAALTPPTESCYSPAVSPDGTKLAMVCTGVGQGDARLVVAPFANGQLGAATALVQGQVDSPTWSPDGTGLLYFAPGGADQDFQLFYQLVTPPPSPTPRPTQGEAAAPTPVPLPAPRQMTTENAFDATAPPVWFS